MAKNGFVAEVTFKPLIREPLVKFGKKNLMLIKTQRVLRKQILSIYNKTAKMENIKNSVIKRPVL